MMTTKRSGPVRPAVDGDERQEEHVGQLDDARRRPAEREHLEDGRPVRHEAVRPAELVARHGDRLVDPLAERGLLVERLQQLVAREQPREPVALGEVGARPLVPGAVARERDELKPSSPSCTSPPCMRLTCFLRS